MTKPKIQLVDAMFPGCQSMSLWQENKDDEPAYFTWQRVTVNDYDHTRPVVVTDAHIDLGAHLITYPRIGILIEPVTLHPENYNIAWDVRRDYDIIFTHYEPFVTSGKPFRYFPYGGSYISFWGNQIKTRMVSMVVGAKNATPGHQLRHRVAEHLARGHYYMAGTCYLYGEPYTEHFESKRQPLAGYYYSVVIENDNHNWWFTEKLLDAFAMETVPVYWGCPGIGRFFDTDGMILFEKIDEIPQIFKELSTEDYVRRLPAVRRNKRLAYSYRCAEDWLWKASEGFTQ